MKKIIALIMIFTVVLSCKEDKKTDVEVTQDSESIVAEDGKTMKQSDGLIAVQGDFIYYADAAVLKTPTKMYGVVINEEMQDLQEQVKAFKKEDTDMVPVTVRGRMFKKDPSEEGWEDRIEIKEILKVSPPNPEANDVIKIGSK
ncbi:hypothetical protein [Psychroserpens luteus]|uniref:NlpE N-terminal domain-containing protein n=1 Tax=Psychroserpens luteus TaxID=1434066 RepID=A0ABW5ZU24_9FLAO|nr:hypothetical protein [Psychroserpens luteus]